ncbi:MAG: ABC transporter ATP-binding protein [Peptococcaceae bacterium]
MDNILDVINLRKEYQDFTLNNITFHLPRGFIMGFIGPNGAGKSTTIKLIMNLLRKDGGAIKVFGLDHIQQEVEIKQKIGFVYDENYYYEDLNPVEMKRIIAPFYRDWNEQKFINYLQQFDINPKKKIKDLSKGMKMKFSLAVALSHQAELIIMDEPTSGLDPVFRNEILEILADLLLDERKGVLFSTHVTSDLDKIADYITFINKGEIIFSQPKEDIFDNYAVVKGAKEVIDKDLHKEFIGLRINDYGFAGLTNNIQRIRSLFDQEIIIEKATLEDIMLYMVRGNKHAQPYL